MTQRADCADMWQTLWRALRAESTLARGNATSSSSPPSRFAASPGPAWWLRLGAARGNRPGHLVGPQPRPRGPLQQGPHQLHVCRRAEEIIARIEEAYLNLNARYEIAYQTLSRKPAN